LSIELHIKVSNISSMSLIKRKCLLIVIFIMLLSGMTYISWWQARINKNRVKTPPLTSQELHTHPTGGQVKAPSEYDQVVDLIAGNLLGQEIPHNLKDEEWEIFQNTVKTNWADYHSQISQPMMEWSSHEIRSEVKKVFYPFSGPDFATLYQLYPQANHYVMTAQQRGEHLVDLSLLSPLDASQTLQILGSAWSSFGQRGFFVTEYLFKYISLNKARIGSTTLIASFAHLQGFSIQQIVPIEIDKDGVLRELGKEQPWNSVRFYLTKDDKHVIVDYLQMDLSNAGLNRSPHKLRFLEESSKSPILLKAASHLPQHKNFTLIRDAILNNSPFIIQDETGLDYKPLCKSFNTVLYGNFVKPYKVFSTYNVELVKAYQNRHDENPLPFRIGYFKDGNYALIVATRKLF